MDLERVRDVVIVGAGPAGAGAAFWLARQGLDVLLLESKRLPRNKPCGDGIGPRTVLALREMGLEPWLNSGNRYRIERFRIVAPSGAAVAGAAEPSLFPISYGYVIKRDELDFKLADWAKNAGAELLQGCRAQAFIDGEGRPDPGLPTRVTGVVAGRDGELIEIKARLTVVADGSKGRLSRIANPGKRAQALGLRAYASGVAGIDDCVNIFFSRTFPNGYGWIFPTGPTTANVGVGLLRMGAGADGRAVLDAYKHFVGEQDLAPLSLAGSTLDSHPVGSVMQMSFGKRIIQRPGLAFLGDAAGLVSPLNGEGISHALESARLLAAGLEGRFDGSADINKALRGYERTIRRQFGAYFRWANFLSRFLAHPDRLDRLVAKAQRDDYLRVVLTGVLTNTIHPRQFGRPKTLLRLAGRK